MSGGRSLSENNLEVILENLLLLPDINYHAEEILVPIAEKYPLKVVNFFENRVSKKKSKGHDERYEAIPYNLHRIDKVLQKHTKSVVSELLRWFSRKEWRFEWEGSRFFQTIFSTFTSELESELIKLIKNGTKKNATIVLGVLDAYEGKKFLHNVCIEFIKKYPKNEKYRNRMFLILSQTGVVRGEYGFVEAYRNKKEEVQGWKKDSSDAIQSFVKQYEFFLEKRMEHEQKQADESIELRKRELN